MKWFAPLLIAFLVVLVAGCASTTLTSQLTTAAKPTATPVPSESRLLLLAVNGTKASRSYLQIDGFVRNVTNQSLRNVVAVALLCDDNGKFLLSDEARLSYNPIQPGQESPFKILIREDPVISGGAIRFKELNGGEIAMTDQTGNEGIFVFPIYR